MNQPAGWPAAIPGDRLEAAWPPSLLEEANSCFQEGILGILELLPGETTRAAWPPLGEA